jgi:hypothetical protein
MVEGDTPTNTVWVVIEEWGLKVYIVPLVMNRRTHQTVPAHKSHITHKTSGVT